MIRDISKAGHIGGYSSIGRTAACGAVSSLFKSGYPPFFLVISGFLHLLRGLP